MTRVARWLAALTFLAAAEAHADLQSVLRCMRANLPERLRIPTAEFSTYDTEDAEPRITIASLAAASSESGWSAAVRILQPADLAGTAYLFLGRPAGDEVYDWQPAAGQVRRLAGVASDAPILGTNISQRDLAHLFGAVRSQQIALGSTRELAGRTADMLSIFVPQPSTYREVLSHVDRETCVALRVEFNDERGTRKELRADPATLASVGSFRYAAQVEMRDLREKSRTVVRLSGVETGVELGPKTFDPAAFHR